MKNKNRDNEFISCVVLAVGNRGVLKSVWKIGRYFESQRHMN